MIGYDRRLVELHKKRIPHKKAQEKHSAIFELFLLILIAVLAVVAIVSMF